MPTAQLVRIEIQKERRQREAEAVDVEPEERDREKRHRHHADREPDDAHDHQRADEFDRAQRADHQVAEIARPHLFQKRDREAELAAKQDVPHQHGADEHAARAREEPRILRDVELQKSPHQQLHRRPVDQLQQPRSRTSAADTDSAAPSPRPDAERMSRRWWNARSCRPCRKCGTPERAASIIIAPPRALRRARARCRGTPPPAFRGRSGRADAAGVSSSSMRPRFIMMTRSHSRSTSLMLWEASSTVAPRSSRKRSRRPRTQSAVSGSSDAVGSSSSSTSGELMQRLRQRDAGLLSGRELAGRPVEKLREVELSPARRCGRSNPRPRRAARTP